MEKIKYFFLKLDHFLSTFCKKCNFTIENSKKLFSKNDKQILSPQMPDFAATSAMMAATCAILALTWISHLSMCL